MADQSNLARSSRESARNCCKEKDWAIFREKKSFFLTTVIGKLAQGFGDSSRKKRIAFKSPTVRKKWRRWRLRRMTQKYWKDWGGFLPFNSEGDQVKEFSLIFLTKSCPCESSPKLGDFYRFWAGEITDFWWFYSPEYGSLILEKTNVRYRVRFLSLLPMFFFSRWPDLSRVKTVLLARAILVNQW